MRVSIEECYSVDQIDLPIVRSVFTDDLIGWVGDYWENIDDKRDATRTEETDQPASVQ